jgi:adenylylsulfate kinase-like enzyme
MLPDNHPGKINNLSGVNDPYESPQNADLVIHTNLKPEDECIKTLVYLILKKIQQ